MESLKLPSAARWLIVIAVTVSSFLLFGGWQFLRDPNEANYAFFHNADDKDNPIVWLMFAWQYGFLAGLIGVIVSVLAIVILAKHSKGSDRNG